MILQTSGAKIFSVFAGAPTDKPLLDTDPNLYDIQKSQVPAVDMMKAVRVSRRSRITNARANFLPRPSTPTAS